MEPKLDKYQQCLWIILPHFLFQISVSMQRGITTRSDDGSLQVKNNNAIDVFKVVHGTPAYWKVFRNEIFAMQ